VKPKGRIEMEAYDKGYYAFYAGKKPEDNPYMGGSEENRAWRSGYVDADTSVSQYESSEREPEGEAF